MKTQPNSLTVFEIRQIINNIQYEITQVNRNEIILLVLYYII